MILWRGIRPTNAEVLSVNSQVAFPLDAGYPLTFGDDGWRKRPDDHVEPLVWIVLIQTHLKVLRRSIIVTQHCAPFNVEDAARLATCHGRKDPALAAWETRAAGRGRDGKLVLPNSEDGVVIWKPSEIARRRWKTRCDKPAWFVCIDKVQAAVGANVHPGVGGAVQLEAKRQRNKRIAFVAIVANVCVTRHDPVGALSYDILVRTTFDRVVPVESGARLAKLICDRSTGRAGRRVASGSAARLFNRAYEHGPVEWKHVLNGGPHIADSVEPVAATKTRPVLISVQVELVLIVWRPARADVHTAISDLDVQR